MATSIAPPIQPKSLTSPSVDPLYAQAINQAKASLAAQTAPIQNEQAASDQAYQSSETDATNVAAALAKLLQGIGPATQATYDTAAQNQALLGKGFSQDVQNNLSSNTDSLNSMLSKLGVPATIDGKAGETGSVLNALGGYIPATTFNKEGAGYGAAGDQLPAIALLNGQQENASLKAKAVVADQGFQAKIAELAGNLPGVALTNYQHLQTLALSDAKFREQVANDQTNAAYKTATLKLAQDKATNQVNEFNVTSGLKAQSLQLQAQKFAQQTVNQDRAYQLSLQRIGLETKSLQLRAAALQYKYANNGFTPVQVVKLKQQASTLASAAFAATDKTTGKPVTYQAAMRELTAQGIPASIAQMELASAGFKVGDNRGTPTLHDQQPILADPSYQALGNINQIQVLGHQDAVGEIAAGAQSRGLDPRAVLAVASQEGIGGGVGDGGTSFGPFQLHAGGALPASVWAKGEAYAAAWAWSPAGINYALDQIAKVARGLTGTTAINNIVRRFERPANPGNEVAGATAAY